MKKLTEENNVSSRMLWLVLLLLPIAILFFMPGGGLSHRVLWFWLTFIFFWFLILTLLGVPGRPLAEAEPEPRMLAEEEQPEAVREVMNVRVATEEKGVRIFRGRLRESAAAAFEKLKRAVAPQNVPLLTEDEQLGAAIVLMPKPIEEQRVEHPTRPWLHWLLFALTVFTTTWAGAAHQGVDLLREPGRFAVGLPYSLGLMVWPHIAWNLPLSSLPASDGATERASSPSAAVRSSAHQLQENP